MQLKVKIYFKKLIRHGNSRVIFASTSLRQCSCKETT